MTAFCLAALIVIPVTGALAARSVASLHCWLLATITLWMTMLFGWLALATLGEMPFIEQAALTTLIELESNGGAVALSFELSSVRVGLLLSGLLLFLPVLLRESFSVGSSRSSQRVERSLRLQLGILFAGAVALLSDDLFVVVAAWLLLDSLLIRFAEIESAHIVSGESEVATDAGALLPVLRLSSVALVAAVLLAATRYHSTSLCDIIAAAQADTRIDADLMRGGILVWVALAVAGRAALFPAGIWMRPLAESGGQDTLPVVAWAAILPAIGVWLSLNALLGMGQESSLLLAVSGGLTGVTFAAIAIASRPTDDIWQPLPLLAVAGAFSLMNASVPVLSESADGLVSPLTSALILLSNAAAIGALSLTETRRGASLLAAVFLISGIGGPNLLLDQLHQLRQTLPVSDSANALAAGTTPVISGSLVTGLWWAVCVTQLLIGVVVANRLLRRRHSTSAVSESETRSAFAAPMMLVLAIVGGVALLSSVVFASRPEPSGIVESIRMWAAAAPTVFRQLISFNAATPSGLLGAVCVWLFLQASSTVQDRLRASAASLQRLAQNWFYVGDSVAIVRIVIGWIALIVEVFDRRILGGRRDDAWRQNADQAARGIEEIGEHGAGYPSLAALLAVTGLLLALAGFGRWP